ALSTAGVCVVPILHGCVQASCLTDPAPFGSIFGWASGWAVAAGAWTGVPQLAQNLCVGSRAMPQLVQKRTSPLGVSGACAPEPLAPLLSAASAAVGTAWVLRRLAISASSASSSAAISGASFSICCM